MDDAVRVVGGPRKGPHQAADAGTGRVRLIDIARHAGVSRSTVSLVLRGSPLVAEATRALVRQAMTELGYVYDRSAARLRTQKADTVGLLISQIANPFFAELAAGIDQVVEGDDQLSFIASTHENPDRQDKLLTRLLEQAVGGVIVCPAIGSGPGFADALVRRGIAVVQALRHVTGAVYDYAAPDYRLGARLAAQHLVALGHRQIVFAGGSLPHSASAERLAGFHDAMADTGLAGRQIPASHDREGGAAAAEALLALSPQPTAALCYNDILALGLIHGLADRGVAPGRSLAVIGFDNLGEAAMSRPGLTTVATNPRQIGVEAATLLARRMAQPGAPRQVAVVPPQLVVRQSCGAAAAAPSSGDRADPEHRPG